MRTLCLGIAAISTFLFVSCPANRANAITLGGPSAIRTALADIAVTYPAHCRPGRVHHRYWPYDGCAQGYVSPSYYHYRRSRSSDSSKHNGISRNSISKSGSMGGHGGGHK
jgi:beta-galactosidase GanA